MACRVVLAIIWVLCASNTLPADDFPYEAQVISDAGTLRSGAGETFYATGQLMKGETVEVYRHVGTDWCAIRPASGSFSYVRADHVRVTEDEDVIEVTVAGTKTRVGSEVSDAHNVEYVSLHQGERLRRFGEPVTFGRSKQLWYKVNPPSGEFRFISRHEIESLSEPADPSSPAESENVPLAQSDSDATTAEAEQAADDPHDSSLNRQAVSLEQVVEQATGRPATQAVLPASHDTTERPASETTPPDFADAEKAATEIAEASKPQSTRTARAPRRSKTSGKVSAKSDQNSDSIPLEKMAARGGQMATEQIPQTVDALSPSKDAKNKESNAQKASSPGASAGPFVETAQNVTSDTAGGNGSVAPGPNRRVVKDWAVAETSATMDVPLIDSAWTPVDTGAPMPPTPEIVDQALGQIASLELELSRIVTQDVGTWRFESLQGKLLELRRSNSDPEVQRSVNNLWQRTQEFVDLQRRHLALLAVSPSSVVVPPPMPNSALQLAVPGSVALTSNASPRDPLSSLSDGIRRATGSLSRTVQGKSDSARNRESSAPQFAGRGWLVPVLTARPDLPRFALTDAQGRIRNFVTASPGVNLRRYMRQEVGVVGTAEPGPTGEAGRLVADRIVVLNRTQR